MFIKEIQLATEVCSTECPDHLKVQFNISKIIKALQQKYSSIIKEFDDTKSNEVSVTYWMKQLPEGRKPTDEDPDWEYVKNIVEESLPLQIKYRLHLCGELKTDDIKERAVSKFKQMK